MADPAHLPRCLRAAAAFGTGRRHRAACHSRADTAELLDGDDHQPRHWHRLGRALHRLRAAAGHGARNDGEPPRPHRAGGAGLCLSRGARRRAGARLLPRGAQSGHPCRRSSALCGGDRQCPPLAALCGSDARAPLEAIARGQGRLVRALGLGGWQQFTLVELPLLGRISAWRSPLPSASRSETWA